MLFIIAKTTIVPMEGTTIVTETAYYNWKRFESAENNVWRTSVYVKALDNINIFFYFLDEKLLRL